MGASEDGEDFGTGVGLPEMGAPEAEGGGKRSLRLGVETRESSREQSPSGAGETKRLWDFARQL